MNLPFRVTQGTNDVLLLTFLCNCELQFVSETCRLSLTFYLLNNSVKKSTDFKNRPILIISGTKLDTRK